MLTCFIPVKAILQGEENYYNYIETRRNDIIAEYNADNAAVYIMKAVEGKKLDKINALGELISLYNQYGKSINIVCAMSTLMDDPYFSQNISDEQSEIIREILSTPTYNKTYISGNFEIRYNSTSNSTPVYIISLMNALTTIETSFITDLSLNRPQSSILTHRYHFYVTSDYDSNSNPAATFFGFTSGFRTSYSVFYGIQDADLNSSLTTYEKGTAAHEYMHAINHNYFNLLYLDSWFKESWANWAALIKYGISTIPDYAVNAYLSNTNYPLTSNNFIDNYGKVLLPMFIRQNYGGDSTVAEVIKKLPISGDAITAIGNALPGDSVTLNSIFADFMRYNYSPKYFYTTHSNGWNDRPLISGNYSSSYSSFTASNQYLDTLSAKYYEFDIPSVGIYRYNIIVNAGTSTITGKLMLSYDSGYATNTSLGSGTYLEENINISSSAYSKGCIMIVNTDSLNATGNITITVTRTRIH